jgi:hypothetical protein
MVMVAQDRLVEVESVAAPAAERAPVGSEKTFRAYDPDQVLLMAPSLQDWVPDGLRRPRADAWPKGLTVPQCRNGVHAGRSSRRLDGYPSGGAAPGP